MREPEDIVKAGEGTRFSGDRQPTNRPGNPGYITKYIREYGEATKLETTVSVTKPDRSGQPKTTTTHSCIEAHGEQTVFQAIAMKLLQQAWNGDIKAIKEVLNRTEGRVAQPINLGDANGNALEQVLIYLPDNNRQAPVPDQQNAEATDSEASNAATA